MYHTFFLHKKRQVGKIPEGERPWGFGGKGRGRVGERTGGESLSGPIRLPFEPSASYRIISSLRSFRSNKLHRKAKSTATGVCLHTSCLPFKSGHKAARQAAYLGWGLHQWVADWSLNLGLIDSEVSCLWGLISLFLFVRPIQSTQYKEFNQLRACFFVVVGFTSFHIRFKKNEHICR